MTAQFIYDTFKCISKKGRTFVNDSGLWRWRCHRRSKQCGGAVLWISWIRHISRIRLRRVWWTIDRLLLSYIAARCIICAVGVGIHIPVVNAMAIKKIFKLVLVYNFSDTERVVVPLTNIIELVSTKWCVKADSEVLWLQWRCQDLNSGSNKFWWRMPTTSQSIQHLGFHRRDWIKNRNFVQQRLARLISISDLLFFDKCFCLLIYHGGFKQ